MIPLLVRYGINGKMSLRMRPLSTKAQRTLVNSVQGLRKTLYAECWVMFMLVRVICAHSCYVKTNLECHIQL